MSVLVRFSRRQSAKWTTLPTDLLRYPLDLSLAQPISLFCRRLPAVTCARDPRDRVTRQTGVFRSAAWPQSSYAQRDAVGLSWPVKTTSTALHCLLIDRNFATRSPYKNRFFLGLALNTRMLFAPPFDGVRDVPLDKDRHTDCERFRQRSFALTLAHGSYYPLRILSLRDRLC